MRIKYNVILYWSFVVKLSLHISSRSEVKVNNRTAPLCWQGFSVFLKYISAGQMLSDMRGWTGPLAEEWSLWTRAHPAAQKRLYCLALTLCGCCWISVVNIRATCNLVWGVTDLKDSAYIPTCLRTRARRAQCFNPTIWQINHIQT